MDQISLRTKITNHLSKAWPLIRLPILACLLGLLCLYTISPIYAPPPEGIQASYKIKIILAWLTPRVALLGVLYLGLGVIYQLFFAHNLKKAISILFSLAIILITALFYVTGFRLDIFPVFFEEDIVNVQAKSYRLISFRDYYGAIHYALCECDAAAFQCVCYQIHTYSRPSDGEATSALTLNASQNAIIAHFENGLACTYDLPFKEYFYWGQVWGYAYYYDECREPGLTSPKLQGPNDTTTCIIQKKLIK